MLSRAWCDEENGMVSKDKEVYVDFFKSAQLLTSERSTPTMHKFDKGDYNGEWHLIEQFLSTMTMDVSWTKKNRVGRRPTSFLEER